MRVSTTQEASFADFLIEIPDSKLGVLNRLIDWKSLKPYLVGIEGDYSALSLFKVLLVQTWFNLSDEGVSKALHRDLVYIDFCDFSMAGKKPDASTICRFRNRLVRSNELDFLLGLLNKQLEEKNVKVSKCAYVSSDATLISSARRPRKRYKSESAKEVEYSDDREASWKKKGNKFLYGYAGIVTTDEQGIVEAVSTHTAKDSEMKAFPETVKQAGLKEGTRVLYDKGADSKANPEALSKQKLRDGIMRKKPKGKPMSHWNKCRNKLIGERRFVTERTFGTLKRTYGLYRARYLGLAKVHAEIILKSIAYNLTRAFGVWKLQGNSGPYCA